jgi:hypothetical protein
MFERLRRWSDDFSFALYMLAVLVMLGALTG